MLSSKQKFIADIVREKCVTTMLFNNFMELRTIDWAVLEIFNDLRYLGFINVTCKKIAEIVGEYQLQYTVDSPYNNQYHDKIRFWVKYPEIVPEKYAIESAIKHLCNLNLINQCSASFFRTFFDFNLRYTLTQDGALLNTYRKELDAQYLNFSRLLVAFNDLPIYEQSISKKESIKI